MVNSHSQFDLEYLRKLASEKCAGGLSEDEAAELADMLCQSDAAREEYWEIVAVHAQLDWDLGGIDAVQAALASQLADMAEAPTPRQANPPKQTTAAYWWLALAAGLLVAVSAGAWTWWQGRGDANLRLAETGSAPPTQDSPVVGVLKPLVEPTAWSFGRAGANNSSDFHQGDTIWLEAGAAELRFASDTVAVLESPVIMQVISVDRVRVINGGIKVEVAKGAEGFSVETDSAEVIDLGTVFSVNVENGNTDLVVFDGEVDLMVTPSGNTGSEQPASPAKRFRAGEAVQVAHDGTLSRIVNVRQSKLHSIADRSHDEPLISSVRDNNVRYDFYSFYEIVPGGMGEDAKAFVDRPHEWNGTESTGMPAYLVGGDVVKTFNNDKVIEELVIDVTLTRPSVLYVLIDKRLRPPRWLRESFENTRDEIGIDEVHFDPNDPLEYSEDELRVGAGKGINRTHTIWKMDVPHGGVVKLGANGELVEAPPEGVMSKANMYGVVATPLREFP